MYNTLGLKMGDSFTNTDSFTFRSVNDPVGQAPSLFTGDKRMSFRGGYSRDGDLCILQDKPLPATVLAVIPTWDIEQ